MTQLFRNNAFSKLGAPLASTDTTLIITTGTGDKFPAAGGQDFFLLTLQDASNNIEIVKVVARAGGADAMTVARAQEGTTARMWSLGDIVELRLTAQALAPLGTFAGDGSASGMRSALNVPDKTGGGASGTWNIDISGNAATATTAGHATSADSADTATTAGHATNASSADTAVTADHATSSDSADEAEKLVAANWSVEQSSGQLQFKYDGTPVVSFSSSGGATGLEGAIADAAVSGPTNTSDPNSTDLPVMLTNHAHGPDGGASYWHIFTMFYSTRSGSGNRAQLAIDYTGSGRVCARSCYSSTWTPWNKLWGSGSTTISASAPSGGADGDLWLQV